MMAHKYLIRSALALGVAFGLSSTAHATNGMFPIGFGMKAYGMGGTAIAMPHDSIAAASNPANMGLIGNRVDIGARIFSPIRESSYDGAGGGAINTTYDSHQNYFLIPEMGYNRQLNDKISVGLTIFGNGGMNTHYHEANAIFGTSDAGIDLMQAFITPSISYKLNEDHTVGLALNGVIQRFKASGLENFIGMSSDGANMTNKGYDWSRGLSYRLGWTGQLTDNITVGATFQPETKMSRFDKYAGLFAENGRLNIPGNYGFGIAIKEIVPKTTVAFDYVRIRYSDVKAIHNPLTVLAGEPLGGDNGSGFAWRDMNVYKLGLQYEYSEKLTLRAGWNYARQPIPKDQTFFNMLAPGVVEHHLSLGGTYKVKDKYEVTVAYMHAFNKDVDGSGSIPGAFGGGEADLEMYQDSIGVSVGWEL
jgi:long-chain fatty acid transport protein